jgi:hypothetical protein
MRTNAPETVPDPVSAPYTGSPAVHSDPSGLIPGWDYNEYPDENPDPDFHQKTIASEVDMGPWDGLITNSNEHDFPTPPTFPIDPPKPEDIAGPVTVDDCEKERLKTSKAISYNKYYGGYANDEEYQRDLKQMQLDFEECRDNVSYKPGPVTIDPLTKGTALFSCFALISIGSALGGATVAVSVKAAGMAGMGAGSTGAVFGGGAGAGLSALLCEKIANGFQ